MTDVDVADPFDLPDWLGEGEVVWRALGSVTGVSTAPGVLTGEGDDDPVGLDLLAVDAAVPAPVSEERHRRAAHLAWHLGETLLLSIDGRTTLAVPGFAFDPDLACEAMRRFARAVGAETSNYAVQVRL